MKPNHGDQGEHGAERGKGSMEEWFGISSDQVHPPYSRVFPVVLSLNPRLGLSYRPTQDAACLSRSNALITLRPTAPEETSRTVSRHQLRKRECETIQLRKCVRRALFDWLR